MGKQTVKLYNPFTGNAIYEEVDEDSAVYKMYIESVKKSERALLHLEGMTIDLFELIVKTVQNAGYHVPDMKTYYAADGKSVINEMGEMYASFSLWDETIDNDDFVYYVKVSKTLRKKPESMDRFLAKDNAILTKIGERDSYEKDISKYCKDKE